MAKRECMNVKIDADLVLKAKVVAAAKRIKLTDYISELLRELIQSDLSRVATGLATVEREQTCHYADAPTATQL